MADENKYSLEAEIGLDFASANSSVDSMVKKLGDLNAAFEALSDSAGEINENLSQTALSKLERLYAKIQETNKIGVNDKQIREKIENAVINAFTQADIVIEGASSGPVKVDLPKDVSEKLKAKLRNAASVAASNIDFEDFDLGQVKVKTKSLKGMKTKLESFLANKLDETIDFETVDSKGMSKKMKLQLSGDHAEGLLNAYQAWAVKMVSDPANFDMSGLPIKPLPEGAFENLIKSLRSSVQRLFAGIKIDTSTFDDINNMKFDGANFNDELNKFVKYISAITTSLNSLNLKASEDDMKQLLQNMKGLKEGLTGQIDSFLDSIKAELSKLPKTQAKSYAEDFNNIMSRIDEGVKGRLDSLDMAAAALNNSSSLMETMNKLVTTHNLAVTKTIEAMTAANVIMTAMEQSAATAVKEAMNTAKADNAKKVDLSEEVNRALDKAEAAVTERVAEWMPSLKPFQVNFEDTAMQPVANAIEAATRRMIQSMASQVHAATKEITKDAAEKGALEGIKVDTSKINDSVGAYMSSTIKNVSDMVKVSAPETESFRVAVRDLHADTRKIIAASMDKTVGELRKINEGTANKGYLTGKDGLNAVTAGNVKAVFNRFHEVIGETATHIVEEYKSTLKDVNIKPDISSAHYLTRRFTEIQDDITRKVKEMLDVQFTLLAKQIRELQAVPTSLGNYSPKALPAAKVPAAAKAAAARNTRSVSAQSGYSSPGGGTAAYYPVGAGGNLTTARSNPGGSTGTFGGSVINTMRYIMAGSLMGLPYMAYNEAWTSAKEFDYEMARARQNFVAKDQAEISMAMSADPNLTKADADKMLMASVAGERVAKVYENWDSLTKPLDNSAEELARVADNLQKLADSGFDQKPTSVSDVAAIAAQQRYVAPKAQGKGMTQAVQNIALAYSIDTQDAARAFQIASIGISDPDEALQLAEAAARAKSVEEVDVEDTAKGLQSVMAQWKIGGHEASDVMNMMIVAANTNLTTVQDLLEVQKRSGAIFANNLPGMTKGEALATSIGLSALYTESTARSGAQGGTFMKNVLTAPFGGSGMKVLQDMAQSKNLEALNPYVTKTNAEGKEVQVQKNGLEVLLGITDAWGVLDDAAKNKLSDSVFKQWFKGDAQALISSLQVDLENAAKDNKVQNAGGAQQLFGNLMQDPKVLAEQVSIMSAGLQDTWKFRQQRVKTMWQASTFEVFENLKDEFGVAANYMSFFLRKLRENASQFADALSLVGKIALAMGARYLGSKVLNNAKTKKFDNLRFALNEEGRAVNLRALEYSDRHAIVSSAKNKVDQKIGLLGIDERQGKIAGLDSDIEGYNRKLDRMREDGKAGSPEYEEIYADRGKKLDERIKLQRMQDTAKEALPGLENQSKQLSAELRNLDRSMKNIDNAALSVNNRMSLMDDAMAEAGIQGSKMRNNMERVAVGFREVNMDSTKMKEAIRDFARQMGMSDRQVDKFETSMDRLNRRFEEGKIDAQKYINVVQRLERMHKLNFTDTMLPSTAAAGGKMTSMSPEGGPLFGMGLFDALTGYTMLKGAGALVGGGTKKAGLFSRIGQGVSALTSKFTGKKGKAAAGAAEDVAGAAVNNSIWKSAKAATTAAGAAGTTSKVGGLLKGITSFTKSAPMKLLKKAKGIPYLGAAMVGMDFLTDGFLAASMSEGERGSAKADNLKSAANSWANMDEYSWLNPMKYISGASNGLDALSSSAINALWGDKSSALSWEDNWKLIKGAWSNSGQELRDQYADDFQYDQKQSEAQQLIQEETLKANKTIDLDGDGLREDTYKTDWKDVSSFEEGQQMVSRILQRLQTNQQDLTSKLSVDRVKMLIQGEREDSSKLRSLMEEFFTENIKALKEALADANERQSNLTEGSDAWNAIESQKKEFESQIAEQQLQQYQNQTAELDSILNVMDEDVNTIQGKYSIKRSDAILGGAKEDSDVVTGIEKSSALAMNERMASTRSELSKLLETYKDNEDMSRKIQQAMLQIDVQSKDNLVSIKKSLQDQKATFNLPEGVQPMTYWESKVKDGTHKSVSVGSGDTVVNVIVDKLTADQSGLNKVGQAVAAAVKKAHTSVSQELRQQVNAGIQNNYR